MLSAHFWMGTGVTLGAAAVMGMSLGSYAISPQAPNHAAQDMIDTPIDGETVQETAFEQPMGPGAIHCVGCGPTLADRRWQADMAALNATDSVDYGAEPLPDYQTDALAEVVPHDPKSTVRPLRPQVARLVTGETEPPLVMVTRGSMEDSPPPVVVATAAEPDRP